MLDTVIINARCNSCKHLVNEDKKSLCRCSKGNWHGVSYRYRGQKVSTWDNCRNYECRFTYAQLILRNRIDRLMYKNNKHTIK